MKINMTFNVSAICKVYSKSDTDKAADNKTLNIDMDAHTAINFLFKFAPYGFNMGEFKVLIVHDGYNNLQGISFHRDDDLYIVTNVNQFLSDILEGYERIIMMERLSNIVETSSFSSSTPDSGEVLDEFDDDVDMKED